jgi:Flp pilus assembly protein TadG
MWKLLRRLLRQTGGGPAVEFGIIFPFIAILILGITQYGMVMFQYLKISQAAQVGANFAMLTGFNVANVQAAATNATGVPASNIAVVETCGCATGTAISATTCGPPMPICGNGLTAGAYVTVTVKQDFTPPVPGITSPLKAAVLVRVLQ